MSSGYRNERAGGAMVIEQLLKEFKHQFLKEQEAN